MSEIGIDKFFIELQIVCHLSITHWFIMFAEIMRILLLPDGNATAVCILFRITRRPVKVYADPLQSSCDQPHP
jgi:hypothetical protein